MFKYSLNPVKMLRPSNHSLPEPARLCRPGRSVFAGPPLVSAESRFSWVSQAFFSVSMSVVSA